MRRTVVLAGVVTASLAAAGASGVFGPAGVAAQQRAPEQRAPQHAPQPARLAQAQAQAGASVAASGREANRQAGHQAGHAAGRDGSHASGDAATAQSSHQHAMPGAKPATAAAADATPVGSVLAMDVYAQRDTIDMLLAVQAASGPELQHRRSRDGARTWSASVTIDRGDRSILPPKRGNDAQIAASGDTIVVTWTTKGTSRFGAGALAAARSADGGRTWQAAPSPADARGEGGQGFTDLAATENGAFFAAWLDERDGSRGLRLARSTDAGRSWAANVTLDAHTCECCWNTLATFDANRVAVLYRDRNAGQESASHAGQAGQADHTRAPNAAGSHGHHAAAAAAPRAAQSAAADAPPAGSRDMALAVSGDAGQTWASRGVVGKFAWGFDGCPHVGGGLAQSIPDTTAPPRAATTGRAGSSAPASASTPAAAPATATATALRQWHAIVWTGAEGKAGVYVLRSGDDGRTWSEPRRLGGGFGHHGAIAARGATVSAAWDAATDGAMAIFASTSTDGGATWAAPQRLTTGGSATHPLLVSTTSGIVAFWTERAPDGRVTWISRPLDRASS